LDVNNGRVVKGVNFRNLRDAGDPVELAYAYYQQGADELTFLDITASSEQRSTIIDVVKQAADQIFIPLTVGGGVRSIEDVDALLRAGADKVSINTAAIRNPGLIDQIAHHFGSQVLVLSADCCRNVEYSELDGGEDVPQYVVTTHGGRENTGIDALQWISEAEQRGVGEILLNSMDFDGTKQGYDIAMTAAVKSRTSLPVIASGGAGKVQDFTDVIKHTDVDAVLAASVFHFGEVDLAEVLKRVHQM
jgi:cyclase